MTRGSLMDVLWTDLITRICVNGCRDVTKGGILYRNKDMSGKLIKETKKIVIYEHYMIRKSDGACKYFSMQRRIASGAIVIVKYDYNFYDRFVIGTANGFAVVYDTEIFEIINVQMWGNDSMPVYPYMAYGEPCLLIMEDGYPGLGCSISTDKFSIRIKFAFTEKFGDILNNNLIMVNKETGSEIITSLKNFEWVQGKYTEEEFKKENIGEKC